MNGFIGQNNFLTGGLALMIIGGSMALLRRLPAEIWGFLVRRCSISVEIPDRDPAFRWVQCWLAEQRFARRARNLSLTTTWVSHDPDPDVDADPAYSYSSGKLSEARFVLSPAPGMHVLMYRKHLIVLQRIRRDLESGGPLAFQETLNLQILGGDRRMVEDLLRETHRAAMPGIPGLNVLTATRHGCWGVSSWRPKRPLESIVLPDNLLEELLTDLREFLRSSAWYDARGFPHRRGYLLHGPPGNGKTSVVAAVAAEVGLSVAVLSLNNKLLTDDGLRDLVDALPAGCILLMEDIDCAFGPKREAAEETGVTLSGLLNALDGVSSREGRVLFLTTNHPERLDPALVRPGRVDRSFRLGHTTRDQARRLFAWFFSGGVQDAYRNRDVWPRSSRRGFPVAGLCGWRRSERASCSRFRHDPESAARELGFGEISSDETRGVYSRSHAPRKAEWSLVDSTG